MFSLAQIREYTTCYGVPCFIPDAIPFAMDGGGCFYLFDARAPAVDGELPIVFCHSSELAGWNQVTKLETSFLDCCSSSTNPIDLGG